MHARPQTQAHTFRQPSDESSRLSGFMSLCAMPALWMNARPLRSWSGTPVRTEKGGQATFLSKDLNCCRLVLLLDLFQFEPLRK